MSLIFIVNPSGDSALFYCHASFEPIHRDNSSLSFLSRYFSIDALCNNALKTCVSKIQPETDGRKSEIRE